MSTFCPITTAPFKWNQSLDLWVDFFVDYIEFSNKQIHLKKMVPLYQQPKINYG